MKLRRLNLFVYTCLSLFTVSTNAQELKIGNICPDVPLKNIINYSVAETRLYDFKGKFLILDFWGTGCAACIRAFPKLDSLQKRFKDKLQIIAINKESLDSTIHFFKRMKHIKKPAIPFVTEDTALSKLFPHIYVPHHVWIDSNRIVQYITDGHNATAEHIERFLRGNDLVLNEKKYEAKYEYDSPLLALMDKKGLDNLESYSLLMHCVSGISFGNRADSFGLKKNAYHIVQNCTSILELYSIAYSENGKHDFSSSNTVLLEVKDKSRYMIPTNDNLMDKWSSNDSYSYELMLPAGQSKEIYKKMQQDLLKYFNVKGVIEKRSVKCLALIRINSKEALKSKGGNPSTNFWKLSGDSIKFMTNQDFEMFTNALSIAYKHIGFARPLIDKTNYRGRIDIQLSSDAFDNFNIDKLNAELYSYGLALRETNCLREVLILKEAK